MDDLASMELTRLAHQGRHNGEDGDEAAEEPASGPVHSGLRQTLPIGSQMKLALTQSAVGESGLKAKEKPWALFGEEAWPNFDNRRTDSRLPPRTGTKAADYGSQLSESAQGFLEACLAANCSPAYVGFLAKEASSLHPQIAEDLSELVKAAGGLRALAGFGRKFMQKVPQWFGRAKPTALAAPPAPAAGQASHWMAQRMSQSAARAATQPAAQAATQPAAQAATQAPGFIRRHIDNPTVNKMLDHPVTQFAGRSGGGALAGMGLAYPVERAIEGVTGEDVNLMGPAAAIGGLGPLANKIPGLRALTQPASHAVARAAGPATALGLGMDFADSTGGIDYGNKMQRGVDDAQGLLRAWNDLPAEQRDQTTFQDFTSQVLDNNELGVGQRAVSERVMEELPRQALDVLGQVIERPAMLNEVLGPSVAGMDPQQQAEFQQNIAPMLEKLGVEPGATAQESLQGLVSGLEGFQEQAQQMPEIAKRLAPLITDNAQFIAAKYGLPVDQLQAAGDQLAAGDMSAAKQLTDLLAQATTAHADQTGGGNIFSEWMGGVLGQDNPITQFLGGMDGWQVGLLLGGVGLGLFGLLSAFMGNDISAMVGLGGGLAMGLGGMYGKDLFGGGDQSSAPTATPPEQALRDAEQPGPYGQHGGQIGPPELPQLPNPWELVNQPPADMPRGPAEPVQHGPNYLEAQNL